MAQQFSVAVRDGWAESWESTIGTSPKIQIRSGAPPANCAAAATGTLLAEFTLGVDWSAVASSGAKTLAGLPLSTTASAAGTAAHYRIVNSAGTTCHEQGTVGTGSEDMVIDNASITSGQTVRITAYTKTWAGA